jgi:lantibiotic modifying enzyme
MEVDHVSLDAEVRSILGFIKRTAESSESGCSWETIDYANKPHRSPSIFNGVGGISFFLVDAYGRTGDREALGLAQGAIDWCAAYTGKHYERGLHFGKTGAALAALHKAVALGEKSVPEFCRINADTILREPPGPVTDLIGGEASNGLYLLKLWERAGDAAHLNGAERCAAWLELNMIRDSRGTHCTICPNSSLDFPAHSYLGVAHGISGVGHFIACLAEATGKDRWAGLAREIFDTIERYAIPIHGGLNWPNRIGSEELVRCQWSHGAAGIGLTYLTAYRALRDTRYLDLALKAAEATYGYGDFRNNCTLCTGLAGSGGLFLEVYHTTGDQLWKDRAHEFARLCIAYKESTLLGDAWPTDAKGLYSADYDYGAAGVGHFFLRLLSDGKLPQPIM